MENSKLREREHWLECKITEIIEVTGSEPEAALPIAEEFLSTNRIPFNYTLYFEKHGYVVAAEVLSNPHRYDLETLCDPLRINHAQGRDEAVFHWNDGNPVVQSYAKLYKFSAF